MTSSRFATTNLCQCEHTLILTQLSALRPYCPVNLITLRADSECHVDLKLRGIPWSPYSYCMMFSLSRAVQRRYGREWAIVAFIMLWSRSLWDMHLACLRDFCQRLHELTMLSYTSCANTNHESFMADNCMNCMNDDMHNDLFLWCSSLCHILACLHGNNVGSLFHS